MCETFLSQTRNPMLQTADIRFRVDFRLKLNILQSPVPHSDIVLLTLCPCERYRQLNSVLYSNNHLLKSSKIIFNRLVLNDFMLSEGGSI